MSYAFINSISNMLIALAKRRAVFFASALFLMLGACSNGSDSAAVIADDTVDVPVIPLERIVGKKSMAFVDESRTTAAHDSVPEASNRTIETTIVYPAEGTPGVTASQDAPADMSATPYPLVVLSHGLGGSPEHLLPLAEMWAAKGYVVALPKFPLTNTKTQGGPVAQDVQNQPADVSFIIDELLAESSTPGSALDSVVDGDKIAVSGHSNGAITSYGLIAHDCCRDPRIDAAIIFSGATSPFGGGAYDLSDTPPVLVVHGVNDRDITYNGAVVAYNQLQPPKGLLTLEEADHVSYFNPESAEFDIVTRATLDFFDGMLLGDSAALELLAQDQGSSIATIYWAADEATNVPVEKLPEPETNRQAVLSASNNLTDGQVITVSWSGFLPGLTINVVQCNANPDSGSAGCDISGGVILHPDPEGLGSLELTVHTGAIGDGVCDSANPCNVLVNDAGLSDEAATINLPVTFAD